MRVSAWLDMPGNAGPESSSGARMRRASLSGTPPGVSAETSLHGNAPTPSPGAHATNKFTTNTTNFTKTIFKKNNNNKI